MKHKTLTVQNYFDAILFWNFYARLFGHTHIPFFMVTEQPRRRDVSHRYKKFSPQ